MKYKYATSLKELRSSLKYRSKQYLLENTLHGVPYFVDPTRPKWERIMWFFLTMASLAASFTTIAIIWDKFQTEPTMTEADMNTGHIEIDFPEIYVCYNWNELNHSHLQQSEMYIYEQLYNWEWGQSIELKPSDESYREKSNFRDTFKLIGPNCDLLFNNCRYKDKTKSCTNFFTKVLTPVGACCKFSTSETLIYYEKWDLTFNTTLFPWRLYVMHKIVSSPSRNERPLITAYFPLDILFSVSITYVTYDLCHLTRRQRQCHYEYEGPSFNDCEMNCLIEKIYRNSSCLPWFLASSDRAECPISMYSNIRKFDLDANSCKCTLTCNYTSYILQALSEARVVNSFTLSEWPDALYKRETRFGYLDLLVSFGGIAGLFLGYSLLTSIEMGYYFSLRTYCGAVVESSRKQYSINKVQVIEAKLPRKLSVSPIYYQYVD